MKKLNPKVERWFNEGSIAAAILGGSGYSLIDRNWNAQDRILIFSELFEWAGDDPDRRQAARRGIESALRVAVNDEDVVAATNIVWTYLLVARRHADPLSRPLDLVQILRQFPEEDLNQESCTRTTAAIREWLHKRGLRWS
jgi:hypothetical protein